MARSDSLNLTIVDCKSILKVNFERLLLAS